MTPGLTVAQVASVLQALGRADAILIGGQALQIWCDFYVELDPELNNESPFTSKDVDVQGDLKTTRVCAELLSVKPRYPAAEFDPTNVALIEVLVEGRVIEVNVLTSPYGVTAKEARQTAIPYQVGEGSIQVLHPVLCMESRLANVAGLFRTQEQSVRQARASIRCARAFLAELASQNPREALKLAERVFRYARDNRNAREAFVTHQLDAFDVVDAHLGLPSDFAEKRLPQMITELTRDRERRAVEATRRREYV